MPPHSHARTLHHRVAVASIINLCFSIVQILDNSFIILGIIVAIVAPTPPLTRETLS